MFHLYTPDDFTHNTLRRVWVWLQSKHTFGSCYLADLKFDATAPKMSIIGLCMTKSQVSKPYDRNLIPPEIPSQRMRERLLKSWDIPEHDFENCYALFRLRQIDEVEKVEFKQPVTFREILNGIN